MKSHEQTLKILINKLNTSNFIFVILNNPASIVIFFRITFYIMFGYALLSEKEIASQISWNALIPSALYIRKWAPDDGTGEDGIKEISSY